MRHNIANQVQLILDKSYSKIVADDFIKQYDLYVKNIKLLSGVSEVHIAHVYGFFAAQNIDIKSLSSKFNKLNLNEQIDVLARSYIKSFKAKQRYLTWTINKDVSVTFDIVKRDVTILDCETLIQMSFNKFKNEIYSVLTKNICEVSRFNRINVNDIEGKHRTVIISVRFGDETKRIRFADASPVLTEQNMIELNEIMQIID